MRMEVDAIWPHSQDRRHTLSISPFHEIEVAREARHNLGMHHLAKMCWVVSVFASKDNAKLERRHGICLIHRCDRGILGPHQPYKLLGRLSLHLLAIAAGCSHCGSQLL